MKIIKKLFTAFLALTLVIGVLLVPSTQAKADSYGAVPKKVRIYAMTSKQTLSFDLPGYDYTIANLKSSNSKLKVKQTFYRTEEGYTENSNFATISLYASKEGTYKVSFDILDAQGKKVSSKKITVYARNDSPLKTLKLGKNTITSTTVNDANMKTTDNYLLKGNSGKVKVTLAKGYKLKKIEYGIYDKAKKEIVYTTVKNNKKITYGKDSSEYSSKDEYFDEDEGKYIRRKYWTKSAVAGTFIRVSYLDKYTKQENTLSYSFYKLLY
ncbi:MAG: hypothetical protein H2184_03555 [Candidatus Galacturonibacter soehngenii]|nr:hypothetical protein [Candidatus Galacturonibacter soehngenii]